MGHIPRVDVAGLIYHAYNRANVGAQIFNHPKDYVSFEHVMTEAKMLTGMNILAYCIMPNHWHFVLQPKEDGDMSRFFHWLTVTHVRRWHEFHDSMGQGHLYQGTYKSNICQEDEHFLQLVRYVERNALRAKLVTVAEDWKYSSAHRRMHGTEQQRKLLSEWPVDLPDDYLAFLNEPQANEELGSIRTSIQRGRPLGLGMWMDEMVEAHKLESTIRERGRPKKGT